MAVIVLATILRSKWLVNMPYKQLFRLLLSNCNEIICPQILIKIIIKILFNFYIYNAKFQTIVNNMNNLYLNFTHKPKNFMTN